MMFWKCASEKPDTNKSELVSENLKLKAELENLRKVLDKINAEMHSSEFAVDFEEMNAFSIERYVNGNVPCTLIGYFIDEPVVADDKKVGSKKVLNQWYLYCSQERHAELVEQFKIYKKGKKK